MELVNLYLLQHKESASQTQITCAFDDNNKPRVSSVKMMSGNVISLSGVRSALEHFEEGYKSAVDPEITA